MALNQDVNREVHKLLFCFYFRNMKNLAQIRDSDKLTSCVYKNNYNL